MVFAKSNRSKALWAFLTIVFLASMTLAFFLIRSRNNTDTTPPPSTYDEQQLREDIESTPETVENPTPASIENTITTEQPTMSVKITALRQESSSVSFEIDITNRPKSGECIIRLERQNNTRVEKKLAITNSSCKQESLDFSNKERGEWTATVLVVSDGVVATDAKTIAIQ
jgi:hypothetical protein